MTTRTNTSTFLTPALDLHPCQHYLPASSIYAVVAELVDAPDSGSGGSNPVEVRVFSTAHLESKRESTLGRLPFLISCSGVLFRFLEARCPLHKNNPGALVNRG